MRRSFCRLRWLRGAPARGFARGIVAGALLCGLSLASGYFALSWFRGPVDLIARIAPPTNAMPALAPALEGLSAPELKVALAHFLIGEAALIVGSSETGGERPDFVPMSERVAACAGGAPFAMPRPRYGGMYRAALLMERLHGGFAPETPVRLIVLDNSHYATAGTATWPDPRAELGVPAHLEYHLLQHPDSILFSAPGFPPATHPDRFAFIQARLLEWRSFRYMLGRRGVRPLRQALADAGRPTPGRGDQNSPPGGAQDPGRAKASPFQRARDADWQVAARFVPDARQRADLRERKALQQDLANAVYGRAARALAEYAREILPAGSEVRLIVLPLHERFYRRLGFSDAELRAMQSRRLDVLRANFADSPVRLRVATELASGDFFYDSIHYRAAGRERLALSLCEAMQSFPRFATAARQQASTKR